MYNFHSILNCDSSDLCQTILFPSISSHRVPFWMGQDQPSRPSIFQSAPASNGAVGSGILPTLHYLEVIKMTPDANLAWALSKGNTTLTVQKYDPILNFTHIFG